MSAVACTRRHHERSRRRGHRTAWRACSRQHHVGAAAGHRRVSRDVPLQRRQSAGEHLACIGGQREHDRLETGLTQGSPPRRRSHARPNARCQSEGDAARAGRSERRPDRAAVTYAGCLTLPSPPLARLTRHAAGLTEWPLQPASPAGYFSSPMPSKSASASEIGMHRSVAAVEVQVVAERLERGIPRLERHDDGPVILRRQHRVGADRRSRCRRRRRRSRCRATATAACPCPAGTRRDGDRGDVCTRSA